MKTETKKFLTIVAVIGMVGLGFADGVDTTSVSAFKKFKTEASTQIKSETNGMSLFLGITVALMATFAFMGYHSN
jgi:energy-converting hydrogenase Eha subunit G